MAAEAINLIILILLFCCAVWGVKYLCDSFKAPTPVYWVCLVFFLILIFMFLTGQIHAPVFFHR